MVFLCVFMFILFDFKLGAILALIPTHPALSAAFRRFLRQESQGIHRSFPHRGVLGKGLVGRLVGRLVAWLLGRLVGWLLDRLVGRLVGRLLGWLLAWLLGWLLARHLAGSNRNPTREAKNQIRSDQQTWQQKRKRDEYHTWIC